jgi:hypothetical protein
VSSRSAFAAAAEDHGNALTSAARLGVLLPPMDLEIGIIVFARETKPLAQNG